MPSYKKHITSLMYFLYKLKLQSPASIPAFTDEQNNRWRTHYIIAYNKRSPL